MDVVAVREYSIHEQVRALAREHFIVESGFNLAA